MIKAIAALLVLSPSLAWSVQGMGWYQPPVQVSSAVPREAGSALPACTANPPATFLDQFNRTDEDPIGGGFSATGIFLFGDAAHNKIVSNQAAPNATQSGSVWDTQLGAGKQVVYFSIPVTPGTSNKVQGFCRMSTKDGLGNGYELFVRDGNQRFYEVATGVDSTGLGAGQWSETISNGDDIHMVCDPGGDLSFYLNGNLIGTVNDTTYASQGGYVGFNIGVNADQNTRVDDFAAHLCQ